MSAPEKLTLRQQTGLQACYQAESVIRALLHAAHHSEFDELPHLMQAMLPRLMELNSVSMSAHDTTDSEGVPSMIDRLHGGYAMHIMGKDLLASQGGAA